MDDHFRRFSLLQEQIKKMLEPQLRLQNQVQDILKAHQFDLSKYAEPHGYLAAQFERQLFPMMELKRQVEQFAAPQNMMEDSIRKMLEPQIQLQQQIDEVFTSQLKQFDALKDAFSPEKFGFGEVSRFLDPLNQYVAELASADVHLSDSASLIVDGYEVSLAEVDAAVEQMGEPESEEALIQRLIEVLGRLAKPVRIALVKIFITYFLAILANLTTPIYADWWEQYSHLEPRVAKKEIVRDAEELFTAEQLLGYRFVYATLLHVRAEGVMSGEVIDALPMGKTVKVVERRKSWSLIEYEDPESEEVLQGWVFSRYLMKFRE